MHNWTFCHVVWRKNIEPCWIDVVKNYTIYICRSIDRMYSWVCCNWECLVVWTETDVNFYRNTYWVLHILWIKLKCEIIHSKRICIHSHCEAEVDCITVSSKSVPRLRVSQVWGVVSICWKAIPVKHTASNKNIINCPLGKVKVCRCASDVVWNDLM